MDDLCMCLKCSATVEHYKLRSVQNSGVARAHPMPGHSMGTLCLRVASYSGPAQLLCLQYKNAEATIGRSRECSLRKFWEFLSFLGRFCSYFRPYHRLELEYLHYEPVRTHRKVTVVLTSNIYTLRSGAYRPRYSEDTDSCITKLNFNTFVHF